MINSEWSISFHCSSDGIRSININKNNLVEKEISVGVPGKDL
jgi:hypothetical protein